MPHHVWAGIDAGKIAHHCVVINDAGEKLLSRKVSNDEADLLRLIGDLADLANGGRVLWAVDLNAGGAALLIALLVERAPRKVSAIFSGSGPPSKVGLNFFCGEVAAAPPPAAPPAWRGGLSGMRPGV